MSRGHAAPRPTCPRCGDEFGVADPAADSPVVHCPRCGEPVALVQEPRTAQAEVGRISLLARAAGLVALPWMHRAGVGVGCLALLGAGGIIPVARRWLADEINDSGDVVAGLGGVRVSPRDGDELADFGPILRRGDAPPLLDLVSELARRLGIRPPEEVRLAYLPCCGVVARRGRRAVLVGLPLLQVLTQGEFQAVLAHEMAHLARGDATRVMAALRYLDALGRILDDPDCRAWGPLRAWSRACRRLGDAMARPVARGQESRADRVSAAFSGGSVAASALVKVALIQPLFREILARHGSGRGDQGNIFTTFRRLWERIPPALRDEMRIRIQADRSEPTGDPHPPLAERLALLQSYPDRIESDLSQRPAWTLVNDPEWLEEHLHATLFRQDDLRPSVFHRSGS